MSHFTRLFTQKTRVQAVVTVSNIAIQMQQEGYDAKTLNELLERLELALCPEDFKKER